MIDRNQGEGEVHVMTKGEITVEDACLLFRQDSETGNIEIVPKGACEPAKADPEICGKLLEMAELMKQKGGKLELNTEPKES